MKKKKILVLFDKKNGTVKHITKGFKGEECMEINEKFKEISEEESVELTEEYYDDYEQEESVLN